MVITNKYHSRVLSLLAYNIAYNLDLAENADHLAIFTFLNFLYSVLYILQNLREILLGAAQYLCDSLASLLRMKG